MSIFLRRSSLSLPASRLYFSTASSRSAVSRSRARCVPLSSCYRSPRATRRIRQYATQQPEQPKNEKESSGSKQVKNEDGSNGNEPTKVPLEGISKASESSATKATGEEAEHGSTLAPGMTKLSPEEEKMVDGLLQMAKSALPASMHEDMQQAMKHVKKEGADKETLELIRSMSDGSPMNLTKASRLMRLVLKIGRNHTEREAAKETQRLRDEFAKDDSDKAGKTSQEGPQKDKSSKKDQGQSSGGFTEIKLDTGSMLTAALTAYLLYRLVIPSENNREITWQEFQTSFLDKGLVEKLLVINANRVKVFVHREAVRSMYPDSPAVHPNFYYVFTIGSVEAFERKLEAAQADLSIPTSERIPVSYTSEVSWSSTLLSLAPVALIVGSSIWMFRRSSGGGGGGSNNIFSMGRSRAKRFNHETDIQTRFKDVAGMDEAKQEIMEFVSFLKEPGQFQRLGAKIPRGAILSGPPGTGKTLLAKATAGESQVPFFSVSGSEFVEMFVGVGPSRVRDLFANARKSTPCIIFIDEIDAIGKARGKSNYSGGNDERESTLNQILTEMDGFNTSEQVVVLAGTNRPDVLDSALMRPGRFDRHIAIDRPTMDGRKQIFAVHLRKILTDENMEYLTGRLAALTPGFSGADVANACNEAALIGKFYISLTQKKKLT